MLATRERKVQELNPRASPRRRFSRPGADLFRATFHESGWPDSNRRPPRPERGALTKLRYSPLLYPHEESNLNLRLRRSASCPLDHMGVAERARFELAPDIAGLP